MLGKSEGLVWV
jgi:hypothetical protein